MKIEKLTDEQVKKFPYYVKKWVSIGLSTEPTDFEKSVEAASRAYKLAGLPKPKFFFGPFNTPIESAIAYNIMIKKWVGRKFKKSDNVNQILMKEVAEVISSGVTKFNMPDFAFGSYDFWLSFYDYFLNETNMECCKSLQGLIDLSKVCGWWIPLKSVCIFTHRPEKINIDNDGRLHSLEGPAVKFRGSFNGCNIFAVHGVRVTEDIINKKFTVQDIDNNSNVEVRRVMIDIYGIEKYIVDSNAVIISDDDYGTLYRKKLEGDEDIFMVKVANATAEPDGSFKDYWIRVDPNAYGGLKTARDAVASTWRNPDGSLVFSDPRSYDPSIQT